MSRHRKRRSWNQKVVNAGAMTIGFGVAAVLIASSPIATAQTESGATTLISHSDPEESTIVSPRAVSFLAGLRRLGVDVEGQEDTAVDIAWAACHSNAPEVHLQAAIQSLMPRLRTQDVVAFMAQAHVNCPPASS
jgi:hypothetical protein